MLKTPCTWDAKEGLQSWDTSRDRGTLAQQAAMGKLDALLPTPTARDEKNPSSPDGTRIARKMEEGYTIELNDLAAMGLLPTPTCNDATNQSLPISQGKRNDSITKRLINKELPPPIQDMISEIEKTSSPETDGNTSRLSPLFTEEMMGFPFLWTTLPFLKQNGGPKASKPMATPSSRK